MCIRDRLSSSRNEGAVEGDVNVAGIAGSLAIDLEYDPEDDWNQAGDHKMCIRDRPRRGQHS